MKQEDKQLLLVDLCGRLPYGVKVRTSVGGEIRNDKETLNFAQLSLFEAGHEDVKPYLFPISSMTEEQKEEHQDLIKNHYSFDANRNVFTLQDFYNKNHIDYRGLIEKELAYDATGMNIYELLLLLTHRIILNEKKD